MSSFVRRIQRTIKIVRDKDTGERVIRPRRRNYMGRGSKLGVPVVSPWPPRKKPAKKARTPSRYAQVTERQRQKALHKARVCHSYRAPTRAERNDAHREKMARKQARAA